MLLLSQHVGVLLIYKSVDLRCLKRWLLEAKVGSNSAIICHFVIPVHGQARGGCGDTLVLRPDVGAGDVDVSLPRISNHAILRDQS